MSGSNGIPRYEQTNREGEIIDLKTRGANFYEYDYIDAITTATVSMANLLDDPVFTSLTPNTLTGPTLTQILQMFSTMYLNAAGSTVIFHVYNSDPVNPKVITFPGGVTPSMITIPPASYFDFGLSLVAPGGPVNLVQVITSVNSVTDPFALLGNGILVKVPAGYMAETLQSLSTFLTITNPAGQAGNPMFNFDAATLSLFNFNESSGMTGFVIQTGSGTYQDVTLQAGPGIIITDPSGTAALPTQPTFSLNRATAPVFPAVLGATTVQTALQNLAAAIGPFSSISGTGIVTWNGSALNTVSMTQGPGIFITNGSGLAGAPTFSFDGSTAPVSPPVLGQGTVQGALQALALQASSIATVAGTGYIVQTAANTFVTRSFSAGAGLSVANPSGVAGSTLYTFVASTAVVAPVFGGQTTLQGALNALNSNIWPISTAGTGYLVETAPGVYATRTFIAGLNISLANPDGIAGATTINFTPAPGATTSSWTAFYSAGTYGPLVVNTITGLRNLLEGSTSNAAWDISSNVSATTLAAQLNDLKVVNCFQIGTGQGFSVVGAFISGNFGPWGTSSGTPSNTNLPLGMSYYQTTANATDWVRRDVSQFTLTDNSAHTFNTGFARYISCITASFNTQISASWNANEVFSVDVQGNVQIAGTLFVNLTTTLNQTVTLNGNLTSPTGSATFTTGVVNATAFNVISTLASKQKESIQKLNEYLPVKALDMIQKIQPVSFLYKWEETNKKEKRLGFVADSIESMGAPFNQFASKNEKGELVGIDTGALNVLLFQAVRELSEQVQKLSAPLSSSKK